MPETIPGLLSDVFLEQDKVLFEEVLTCFESGALRAAYILTWICIAESIKAKFRDNYDLF